MVDSARADARKRNRRRSLNYFFHEDRLHKVLFISRPMDLMYAWSYDERKRVAFVYSHIKKTHERAFTMLEVCDMVNRSREAIAKYIINGHIAKPPMTYTLDGTFRPSKYMWREKDVLALHDYLVTVHYGRARNDGLITPYPTPTKAELRAMMRHDVVYYVENSKGEKVKAFKEPVW
jgi:hypothetical protein